jgi:hypothetical protein
MKFKIYKEYGALNSQPIFSAFEQGLKTLGFSVVDHGQDVDVIWSVLWQGRMRGNQPVYEKAMLEGRPVMIIEVGNLVRGKTWRVSLNHINVLGIFKNHENLDQDRSKKLGLALTPEIKNRKNQILLACQHEHSLQWRGLPKMPQWVKEQVQEIRKFSSRSIIVRPHPRSPLTINLPGVTIDFPKKLADTYDDYDIDYNYHCVINLSSGPAIQAAISGVPVITGVDSLAYPISDTIKNLESVSLKPREDWFLKLCHTEWTVDEIRQGIPQKRLIKDI